MISFLSILIRFLFLILEMRVCVVVEIHLRNEKSLPILGCVQVNIVFRQQLLTIPGSHSYHTNRTLPQSAVRVERIGVHS